MLLTFWMLHKTGLNQLYRSQGWQSGRRKQLKQQVVRSGEFTTTSWVFRHCSSLSGLKRRAGCCQKLLDLPQNREIKLIALGAFLPLPNLFRFCLKKRRQRSLHLSDNSRDQFWWFHFWVCRIMMNYYLSKFCFL